MSQDFTNFEQIVKDSNAGMDALAAEVDKLIAAIGPAVTAGMTPAETAQLVTDMTALRDRIVAESKVDPNATNPAS